MKQKANLSSLTDEQRAAFARVNALLGLAPDEVTFSATAHREQAARSMRAAEGTSGQPEPVNLTLSSIAEESHVVPHIVPVGSVAEMRRLAGHDDEAAPQAPRPEDEHLYPAPLSEDEKNLLANQPSDMKPVVSPELRQRIEQAATAFVMLDTDRVREYEPLINATMFPGQVTAFVAEDLTVLSGEVHLITGDGVNPVVVNYGTVTVYSGGSIQVDVNCSFTCQTFTQL